MRSTFLSFEIGRRAVLAQQYALDITGHNVANANTAVYSRQEAIMKTTTPFAYPQMFNTSVGQFGTGVVMSEIRRIRDDFMDLQYRSENKTLGLWSAKKDILDKLEGILNEPTDSSLRAVLDAFWESLQNLAESPETDSVRSTVYENASALVETFHQVYSQLKDLREDVNKSIAIKVNEVNSLAAQIADLNEQIQAVVITGQQPNDLLDRRDYLIDELSKLVDVQVVPDRNQMVNLVVSGRAIVQDIRTHEMTVATDENGLYKIVWKDSPDIDVEINSGTLCGLLEGRGVNRLYWDYYDTNITAIRNYFEHQNLVYRVDTQTADADSTAAAAVNELYEYSAYDGSLLEGAAFNLNGRNDINGQILLEVVSRSSDIPPNLQFRYTVDIIDRTGTHKVNTALVDVAGTDPDGILNLALDLNGSGDVLNLDIDLGSAIGSANFATGDKFVLAFTAEKTAGASANDGLVIYNMDTTSAYKNHQLQYYFDEGVLTAGRYNIGTFALNENTGEILRNDSFELAFSGTLKDSSALLINNTGINNRELFAQEVVNPYTGLIPDAMNRLNILARAIIEEFNAVHRQGYNLNTFPDNTNVDFFKDFGDVPCNFEWAQMIDLSDAIKSSLNNIAAASSPTRDSQGNRINYGDGSNAQALARFKQVLISALGNVSIDEYWQSTVSQLGVITQQATRMAENQETLVANIDTQRQGVSGVSLDEEMVNMIRYQHAYNAAARYVTTIDETLDVIINKLGIVGR